ncbi:MAG: GAF domain-containing protein [Chloroflexota bacterium]|nr:MAG: GAF domain-containing protein [Chloroflexota bacterium]
MTVTNRDQLTASKLYVLTEVARTLAVQMELPELLQSVIEQIIDVLEPAELGLVMLWQPATRLFKPQAAAGPNAQIREAIFRLELNEDESITGKVFAEGRSRLLNTPSKVTREKRNVRSTTREVMTQIYGDVGYPLSVIAAPLQAGEIRYGALILETLQGPTTFSVSDLPFVQALADLIALEIDRAKLDAEAAAAHEAQEANRLRSEVMAALSHELRTPLAAIKGYATALMIEEVAWPEEKQQEFLRLIDQETDNLEGMISDMLDSSLIDVGQLEIERQPLRLSRMAEEIADDMLRHTDSHHFAVDFPPGFPIVDADPRRIRQVLRNIVDNAIKYAPDGGLIVIRGEVRPADVVISIADQGVGISPEDMIPLFDKYFRVKAPTGYHVPGTGLGLPVSRAIVEAHGGRIWAESTIGEGTTLYFSIPLEASEVTAPAAE